MQHRYGVDVGVPLRTPARAEWNRINEVLDQFDTEDHPRAGGGTGLGFRDMQFAVCGNYMNAIELKCDIIMAIHNANLCGHASGEPMYCNVTDNAEQMFAWIQDVQSDNDPDDPFSDDEIWGYCLMSFDQGEGEGSYEDMILCTELDPLIRTEWRAEAQAEPHTQRPIG